MKLTGKQKRRLRGLAHDLRFQVQVGKLGVTDTVVESADAALDAHELIKIKFGQGFAGDFPAAVAELARRTASADVGSVGRTALLYRPDPDEPRIVLPRDQED
jgi:RNA-binding protein